MSILVTGATGRIGRLVVDALVRGGASVRALTRHPARANLPAGVEVVAGDFAQPESLDVALTGVDAVFLVWTLAAQTAPAVVSRMASATVSAPPRVVFLSSPHRTPHPFFQQPNPMRVLHLELERVLAASGLDVAVLRPGMFASNVLHWWAPQIVRGDVVRWPFVGAETAPIDERDIAAVAARLLLDQRLAREDVVVTGPESLTQAEQVRTIGDAIGRPLRVEALTPDEFRRDTAGAWPPAVVEMLLAAWNAATGQPALVSDAVHRLLGRAPGTFAQWAADHASAFQRGDRTP